MDFSLAREIYSTPWCLDQFSYQGFSSILRDIRNGVKLEVPVEKSNSTFILPSSISKKNKKVVDRPYGSSWYPGQLDNNEDFEAVGVIHLDGPITKKGGMSSFGMVHLAAQIRKMAKDDRVVSFIIITDSGGGSSAAVDIMADAISEVNESKPVYGFIEKGGMAASAAYGILTACRNIYAEDKMSIVGSVGTMIAFDGKAANTTDQDGNKHIRLYATKSIRKNEDFEQALNNDNYELIVNNLLDPINEDFIKKVQKNRPELKGSGFDDGHHMFTRSATGTFIDGFKTVDQMVSHAFKKQRSTGGPSNSNNVKSKTNPMTIEEVRQNHPETFTGIQNAAVTAERDRVGAWLAHYEANPEKVVAGIKSGNAITQTQTQEFLVEASTKKNLNDLEKDSAKSVTTKETKVDDDKEADEKELNSFYGPIDEQLNS